MERFLEIKNIFISDLHLGSSPVNTKEFTDLLSALKSPDTLFLLGDIIDGWQLRKKWKWETDYKNIIDNIIELYNNGTKITYLQGNHDDFLAHFYNTYGNIIVCEEHIHTAANGKKYLLLHGHQFDPISKYAPIISKLGDIGYHILLGLNGSINLYRKLLKKPYWSFSLWAKQKIKKMLSGIHHYEEEMTEYAKSLGCQGVICGHIHTPSIKIVNGIEYYNCGDFQENATAIIELPSGELDMIDLNAFKKYK
jgi:UDP-2,3-diacylglucosamine pyrophosphatase LpxH